MKRVAIIGVATASVFLCLLAVLCRTYVPPTGIHRAAYLGDLEALSAYISQNYDLDAVQIDLFDKLGTHRTPIGWAVKGDRPEAIRLLIAAGSNTHESTLSQSSPLLAAFIYRRHECLEALLEGGFDPNVAEEFSGNSALYIAVTTRDARILATLISAGLDVQLLDEDILGEIFVRYRGEDLALVIKAAIDAGMPPDMEVGGSSLIAHALARGESELIDVLRRADR